LRLRLGNLIPAQSVIHLNQCCSIESSQPTNGLPPNTHTHICSYFCMYGICVACGFGFSFGSAVYTYVCLLCFSTLSRLLVRIRVEDFKLNKHKSNILQFLSLHAIVGYECG